MATKEEPSPPTLNDPKEQQRARLTQISRAYHAGRRAKRQARQEAGRLYAAEVARRRAAGEPLSQAPRSLVSKKELNNLVIVDNEDKEVGVRPWRMRSMTQQINMVKEEEINRVNENGGVQKPSTEKEGSGIKGVTKTKTAVRTKRANVKTKSGDKSSEKKGKVGKKGNKGKKGGKKGKKGKKGGKK